MQKTTSSRRRPSSDQFFSLLLLALAAPHAVSALSLSNFQLITSTAVPINCILAYNQQLTGCTLSDFTVSNSRRRDRNTCSVTCQAGIARAQETIQNVCGGIQSSGSVTTVLGVALSGDLVGLLCGGSESVSGDSTEDNPETATATAPAAVLQTETTETAATTAAATSDTTTTTSATNNDNPPFVFSTLDPPAGFTTVPTGSSDGVAQAPAAAAAPATSVPPSESFIQNTNSLVGNGGGNGNAAPPSPTVATSSLPLPETATRRSSSTSSPTLTSQPVTGANNRNIFGGGGSPFDEAAANSGAERAGRIADPWTQPWMMLSAAVAAVAAGGVLARW
ncbi:hypothetical protein SPBR_03043 [Sporothrix brasiliensis 5110]|uniref:Uncharacterized protein n=1 Tax=Sporothrix brasiliensis 5110 TaxID=1398154 RepID=A0A0C2FNT9_9PEZI|nr:uncharacterized protein SPBR_03043 [Sporothrix brasiliensis 5110]KIH92678.1 hypothetical protein SPBR_03043 [Sporothrix brasiliensis 5110]